MTAQTPAPIVRRPVARVARHTRDHSRLRAMVVQRANGRPDGPSDNHFPLDYPGLAARAARSAARRGPWLRRPFDERQEARLSASVSERRRSTASWASTTRAAPRSTTQRLPGSRAAPPRQRSRGRESVEVVPVRGQHGHRLEPEVAISRLLVAGLRRRRPASGGPRRCRGRATRARGSTRSGVPTCRPSDGEDGRVAQRPGQAGSAGPDAPHLRLLGRPGVLVRLHEGVTCLLDARHRTERSDVRARPRQHSPGRSSSAMSRATTASPSRAAYRISNTTDRTAAVTGTPSTTTISSGCRNSWLTANPRCATDDARHHGSRPAGRHRRASRRTSDSPASCRAAHPVTASSSLSRAAASTIRCCAVTSTRDGTTSPWLVVRHRGPRDCPRVGPTVPRGSTRTGATSSGGARGTEVG